jgi:hypothetical protein
VKEMRVVRVASSATAVMLVTVAMMERGVKVARRAKAPEKEGTAQLGWTEEKGGVRPPLPSPSAARPRCAASWSSLPVVILLQLERGVLVVWELAV